MKRLCVWLSFLRKQNLCCFTSAVQYVCVPTRFYCNFPVTKSVYVQQHSLDCCYYYCVCKNLTKNKPYQQRWLENSKNGKKNLGSVLKRCVYDVRSSKNFFGSIGSSLEEPQPKHVNWGLALQFAHCMSFARQFADLKNFTRYV